VVSDPAIGGAPQGRAELPKFDLGDYVSLLQRFRAAGYTLRPVSHIPRADRASAVYLRHDVDYFPAPSLPMAEAEAELGCTATYYFLLTGLYNLHEAENLRVLRRLTELGHEIGLHYDLETYPPEPQAAREQLDFEARVLARLSGQPVRTITMHLPFKGTPDPFRLSDAYVHPHDPRWQEDLLYVSDSCRAWRDENLLRCFSAAAPRRLLLLAHPELWMDGGVEDRLTYVQQVVHPAAREPWRRLFEEVVPEIYRIHPAPRLHDDRVRAGRSGKEAALP